MLVVELVGVAVVAIAGNVVPVLVVELVGVAVARGVVVDEAVVVGAHAGR